MKKIFITAILLLACSMPLYADHVNGGVQNNIPGPNFEERKSMMLKRIDERIAHLQEDRACVQAATKPGDLKACQEKTRSEMMEDRSMNKK